MTQDKVALLKLKQLVGCLYLPTDWNKTAIIHLSGGPSLGDKGDSKLWPVAKRYGCALFIPDYIGHCRSDGEFNFKTNIETVYESEDLLLGRQTAVDLETGEKVGVTCKTVVLTGSSWGGAIAPFVARYNKSSIMHIGLFKPVLDWNEQKKTEDVALTDRLIKEGWRHMYRGYRKSEWLEITLGKLRKFNPIDNLNLLKGKHVYICHGKKDSLVDFKQSVKFYTALKSSSPDTTVRLKLINQEHNSKVNVVGLNFMLSNIFGKQ